MPVCVHDEGPVTGGGDDYRLCFPWQADCGLLRKFHVLTVGLTGLEDVDTALLIYGQQLIASCADACEPDVPVSVEDGGRGLLAGPDVDLLVGSEGRLPLAAGCSLQVVESVWSLGGERNLFLCAVLCPNVDSAVAGQAENLAACGMEARVVGFLPVGRADGQPSAGSGPVVRIQGPVCDFCPLGFQGRFLEDRGLVFEELAVMRPPVEPEAIPYWIVFRG